MAVHDLEEQERLDALRDWWESNRVTILTVVAAAVIGFGGYQGWRAYQVSQNEQSEALHKSFSKVVETRDAKKIAEAAAQLSAKYPASFHANDAAFVAAKVAFDAKDYATARTQLQWVADAGKEELRPIARLRLAAVLLEEKKFDEALKVVDAVKAEGFAALAADLKGDILMAKGSKDEARIAWQHALDKSGERSQIKAMVQIKLDSIASGVSK